MEVRVSSRHAVRCAWKYVTWEGKGKGKGDVGV
jgi:hypothetical protein